MALDKWLALLFAAVSLVYGYAAYNYHLLPFERGMSFLPNTMPQILSVLGVALSLIILFSSPSHHPAQEQEQQSLDAYKIVRVLSLLGAMVLYALLLRPAGFVLATVFFLAGASWLLGERKIWVMITVALAAALIIWLLTEKGLGIFLKPWPGP
ncbi:MAG: tripartite tricarboxylate transporter TctB family protein [Gammaproteobacteria bacterium]